MLEIYKPYQNDRLIRADKEGFSVIRPLECVEVTPLFCSLCSFVMRTAEDEKSFQLVECCAFCEENIVYPNRKRWIEEDWRPSPAELDKINQLRSKLSFRLK